MNNDEIDKVAAEIGYINIYFSSFDLAINNLNVILINLSNEKIGEIISIPLMTDRRMQLCKGLLKVIPIKKKIIDKAINNIDTFLKIKDDRNKLIHGIIHIRDSDESNSRQIHLASIKELTDRKGIAKKIELSELSLIKNRLNELVKNQFVLNEEILVEYRKYTENFQRDFIKFRDIMNKSQNNIDS